MNKTVSVGHLSKEVQGILEQYRDDIADGTDKAAEAAASSCVKDIKAAAQRLFGSVNAKKPYAKQWAKKQTEKSRGKAGWTVYCKIPGLPHLLEHGHAKVNGGYVSGRPHIAPAAEKATEKFQREVEEAIRNAGQ